nr:MAG TPA: hypothetical protein [Caudoviricetes sp.]
MLQSPYRTLPCPSIMKGDFICNLQKTLQKF